MLYYITSAIIYCCLLLRPVDSEPSSLYRMLPNPVGLEPLHRKHLETCRRELEFTKEQIKFQESMIRDYPHIFTKDNILAFSRALDSSRDNEKKLENWVEFLERFELQRKLNLAPASELETIEYFKRTSDRIWNPPSPAPMPREVKR